jgi:hypothetical protein
LIGWKNDVLHPIETETTHGQTRVHYLSYNSSIRKTRFTNTTDFDLMRIKFNLVVEGNKFTKDDAVYDMPIPSEFIDISIAGYNDASRKHYINACMNRNFDASKMGLSINNKLITVVKSYDTNDIAYDLQYILFSQNSLEPWIDPKYTKRIYRLLFFIGLNSFNKSITENSHKQMDLFLNFITICGSINQYILDNSKQYPISDVKTLLKNNENKYIDQYLLFIKDGYKNIDDVNYFTNIITISNDYKHMKLIIKSIIMWSFIYRNDNDTIFKHLNLIRKEFLWKPYDPTKKDIIVAEVKDKYKVFMNVVVSTGLKLYYIFELIYINYMKTINANAVVGGDKHNITPIKKNQFMTLKNKHLAIY